MRIGRITVEILGPVPLAPLTVEARVVRPGRSVELLEASLAGPDGEVMRASAWRVAVERLGSSRIRRRPAPTRAATATSSRPARRPATTRRWSTASCTAASSSPARRSSGCACACPLVEGEQPSPLRAPDGRRRRRQRRQRRARLARVPVHQHRADRPPAAPARGRVGRPGRGHARRRRRARRQRPLGRARAHRPGRPDAAGARGRGALDLRVGRRGSAWTTIPS